MSSGRRRAYRPGQKPEWAQEKPQEPDKQQLNVGKRNVVPRKQIVLNLKEHEAVIEEDEDVTAVIEEEEEEQNVKPVFDISALEVPEPEEELDASEQHLRRYEQEQEEEQVPEGAEESSASESTSDEESEEDSEEDEPEQHVLVRPVFVSASQRRSAGEREQLQEEEDRHKQHHQLAKERRKIESHEKLVETLKRDELERIRVEEDRKGLLAGDDTDRIEDREMELELWRLREIKRVLRDRRQRNEADAERKELERRRLLSDAEIMSEKEREAQKTTEKSKIGFLQKYYHKGAFYVDEVDEKLLERDFNAATGQDAEIRDRSLLPKVLQVKNFGFASRSKYTHLTDQDTTGADNPWIQAQRQTPNAAVGFRAAASSSSSKAKPDSKGSDNKRRN